MSSLGMLPMARLRVIGAMTRRFCRASGPSVVFEHSNDMNVPSRQWFGRLACEQTATCPICKTLCTFGKIEKQLFKCIRSADADLCCRTRSERRRRSAILSTASPRHMPAPGRCSLRSRNVAQGQSEPAAWHDRVGAEALTNAQRRDAPRDQRYLPTLYFL